MSNYAPTPLLDHPLCTTVEFCGLIRRDVTVVRRYIRLGKITASGRPALIHVREVEQFGLTLEDARTLLRALRSQDAN